MLGDNGGGVLHCHNNCLCRIVSLLRYTCRRLDEDALCFQAGQASLQRSRRALWKVNVRWSARLGLYHCHVSAVNVRDVPYAADASSLLLQKGTARLAGRRTPRPAPRRATDRRAPLNLVSTTIVARREERGQRPPSH
jgi:hypothetical protein